MAHQSQGPPSRALRTLYPPFGKTRYQRPNYHSIATSEKRGAEMRAQNERAYQCVENEVRNQQRSDDLLETLGEMIAACVSETWATTSAEASAHMTRMEINDNGDRNRTERRNPASTFRV